MNDSLKFKSADEVSADVWHKYCQHQYDLPLHYMYSAAIATYAKDCLQTAITMCIADGQIRLAQQIRDFKDTL